MAKYPQHLNQLIQLLMQLPGIGPKSAVRIAFHILAADEQYVADLAHALVSAKERIGFCRRCANLTEEELCCYCSDRSRDDTTICVVESPRDIAAIEKTGEYRGVYHVLHGAISPMDGIGPEDLHIRELLERVNSGEVREVILATNATLEGETTAMFVAKLLKPLGVRVTRIAHGLPVGGDLEYADEVTLSRALEARREM